MVMIYRWNFTSIKTEVKKVSEGKRGMSKETVPEKRYCKYCGLALVFTKDTMPFGCSTFSGQPRFKGKLRCPVHKESGIDVAQMENTKLWAVETFIN